MVLEYQIGKKIKLTLKKSVYDQLRDDIFTLNIKSMSQLVESVVLAYCQDSKSMTKLEKKDDRELAVRLLLADNQIRFKKALVSLAIGNGNKPKPHFHENETYNWAITVPAYEALKQDRRTDAESPSFVRDLLEEFSSFTVAEKEKILMAKAIEEISCAIEEKTPFNYTSKGGVVYVMHPDRIAEDPYLHYTYVIGHSVALEEYDADTFEPTEDTIKTIRFMNLRYDEKGRRWIKLRTTETLKTNSDLIDRRLEEVSPAFAGETVYDVKVRMTEWGERTYKSIIQNRPRCIAKENAYVDGFREYTFRCTLFQAAIYFMNFEDAAQIISPPEAVERITARVKALGKMYLT